MAGRAFTSLRLLRIDFRKADACRCTRRWYGLISRNWERKRFYKKACAYAHQPEDSGQCVAYGVSLDQRKLKTPLRNLFLVPSESLAAAVAQEWEDQQDFIQPAFMHITISVTKLFICVFDTHPFTTVWLPAECLTLLCNTAIDQPVCKTPQEQVECILPQLDTDLLRYSCQENNELCQLQATQWGPLLDWFNQRYGTEVRSVAGLLPEPVSPKDQDAVRDSLMVMNTWQLTCFSYSVECCKSIVLSAAMTEGHLTPQQTAELALLEQIFQTRRWGRVEWAHDVDQQDMTSRLAAAKIVHSLL